tara:strand:+ start:366 stop:557 length:192 start_codon:yes stop_codon:yes gene_type:complete
MGQLNKVTKKECIDAIEFLWGLGYTQEMTTDKRYYTEVLLKKVANVYSIKLDEQSETTQIGER